MNNYEIFERIINGDLRPHKFKPDGKTLEERIKRLGIQAEDFAKYLNHLDKEGKSYSIIITDPETGENIIDEKRNDEFNELIDIDIPPWPDKKGEVYLDILEFEYVRNINTCEKYVEANKSKEIEDYAIRNFQKLQSLSEDLWHYKKLIVKDKGLDYNNTNDFVIWILEVYLERIIFSLYSLFKPYVTNEYLENTILDIFVERDRKLKEINEIFRQLKLEKTLGIDKRFSKDFIEKTKAKSIQEKIYNEIAYWELFFNQDMPDMSKDEKIELSTRMLKHHIGPLRKAELTGIIRDEKIEKSLINI